MSAKTPSNKKTKKEKEEITQIFLALCQNAGIADLGPLDLARRAIRYRQALQATMEREDL